MRKNKRLQILVTGLLLVCISILAISCSTAEPTAVPETVDTEEDEHEHTDEEHDESMEEEVQEEVSAPVLEGDVVRGGLMYDKWWVVVEADTPSDDHPLWATQDSNTRSGADTWRCKECHGWDYKGVDGAYGSGSHMTGFTGVIQLAGTIPNDVLAAMKGSTNPDHDFSTVMGEQDLIDLAVFITDSLVDSDELINADKTSVGDSAAGEALYVEVCIKCHGPGGNAINFGGLDDPEFLGHLGPDNPWEFAHKVRYGQPGWPMPSGISNDWGNDDVANVLSYAQTFGQEPAVSGGAQLYDAWWKVLGLDAPTEDQPLWSTQSTNERSGADTWRCKECHGWDYMGSDGAYGSGSHMTGFTGILDSANLSSDELMAWLDGSNNPDHNFSAVMEDFALNALVTFIQEEMADITPYVNADGTVSGDPANGRDMFEGTCAACHGVDGKKINFGDDEEPEYVGTVASDNPWEFFHKASFGQPDAPMPSGVGLGWTMEQIADLLAYVKTLPAE